MSNDRPHIVLLMVDQWRADCLGLMDHDVVETPNLDRLFGGGMVFEHAYAAVPSCIAARASLLTGLEPRNHGRVGYQEAVSWDYDQTLPGVLAAVGYLCHCVGKMHVWPARRRLGFHDVELHDGYTFQERSGEADWARVDDYRVWLRARARPDADIVDAGLGCNGYTVRPWPLDDALHPNAWAITRAVDFLRRRDPTRPFFLKVSFHRPHPPLDPPAWCLARYEDIALPPPRLGDWVDPEKPIGHYTSAESPVPTRPREIDRARRAYYAQLTHIDNQINRLVHALQEEGLFDRTAFVFLSDHGEQLYDHRFVGKMQPYEASARIPLMLRAPGAGRDVRVTAPVELMDVLPTLAELASAEPERPIDGRSLLAWSSDSAPAWRDVLHGEHYVFGQDDNQWLVDGRGKYVWWTATGAEQLFDLDADPEELCDLAPSRTTELEPWRKRLAVELAGREEGFVEKGALRPGRTGRPVLESSGLLTEEQIERQRSQTEALRAYFDARRGGS